MKRILSLLTALALMLLCCTPSPACAEACENFIQTFSGNYRNGDKLTSLDFVYFHDGAVHNALDEGDSNVLYFCPIEEGETSAPGQFATMRGVKLLCPGEDVQARYGYRTPRAFDPMGDSVFAAMTDAGDENRIHLENCTRFVVYTFDDRAQIAFYFDGEDTLRFCAYTRSLLYRDSEAMTTLRYGSVNDAVKTMQTRLIELGYLNDTADGRFGTNTEAAVRAFQQAHGLEANGIADPETQQMLYSPKAAAYVAPTEAPTDEPAAEFEEEAEFELDEPVMTLAPMMVITPTPVPEPTATEAPTSTPSPEPTATEAPTSTPSPEPTATEAPTPTPSPEPEPEDEETPVMMPMPQMVLTPTPIPEAEPTEEPAPTAAPEAPVDASSEDAPTLPVGFYYSEAVIVRRIVMEGYETQEVPLYCYILIDETGTLYSACFAVESPLPATAERIRARAEQNLFACTCIYEGAGAYLCTVTGGFYSDDPNAAITFRLKVQEDELMLEELSTPEAAGQESFAEGKYILVPEEAENE